MIGHVEEGLITLQLWRSTPSGRENCKLRMRAATSELISLECTAEPEQLDELLGVRITVEPGPDGKPVRTIRPTGDTAAEFRHRVLAPEQPCPPGYEDLREAFLQALETEKARHGGVCPDCDEGELRRVFLRRIRDRQHEKPTAH